VNIALNLKFKKLDDLCDQIFDYFYLVYYDLETKIDNELNINSLKNKFDTFADKHFKSAIKDFENEIQYLKNKSPHELIKLEKISSEIHQYYNQLVNHKIFDSELLIKLRKKTKETLSKI
jgi:hypothetical protein